MQTLRKDRVPDNALALGAIALPSQKEPTQVLSYAPKISDL